MQVLGVTVFIACGLGLVYVLAGYPLLLLVLSRRSKPVCSEAILPTVTVLLPVYNGSPWIAAKLESILALDYPPERLEILVISDGCDDGTDEIAKGFSGRGVQVLRMPHGGKATALNAGLERATGEILFYTDVRQSLDPGSLRHLVSYFADPTVGVVSGELLILDGRTRAEKNTGLYWKYEKWIRRRHSDIDSVGSATGCIYAMRRALAVPLPAGTILDDVYLPTAAFFRGYRAVWTEGAKAYDYPAPLDVEYRRKVRTQAGIYQVIGAFPALLNPLRNRMWAHFCSHRVGRLLLPFLLIGTTAGSFALPPGWLAASLTAHGLFALLVLADPYVPETALPKRVTSVARTFLVLVAAALSAASILFRPDKNFWTVTRIGPSGDAR